VVKNDKVQIEYPEVGAKPRLSKDLEIHLFDAKSYLVIEKKLNIRILVNNITKELIDLIDGEKSLKEIANVLQKGNEKSDTEAVRKIVNDLANVGIVVSDRALKPKVKAEYLIMSTPFIKAKHTKHIINLFSVLFLPKVFWSTLVVMVIILSSVFLRHLTWNQIYEDIQPDLILFLAGAFFCSLILHELGHITACNLFGATHGDIGFGFYLFVPVFYADVSDAWKLTTGKRIIIDLAGVYMELLFSLVLATIGTLTNSLTPMLVGFLIIINTVKNLNPFLRFDAYWVIADLFNIPNLRSVSNSKLLTLMKWVTGKSSKPIFSSRDYLLAIYAGISLSLVAMFIVAIVFYSPTSIIYFPKNICGVFYQIWNDFDSINFSWIKLQTVKLLMPLSFYVLLLSLVLRSKFLFKRVFTY
jgi:putative peptide zinc metalloprotease protein